MLCEHEELIVIYSGNYKLMTETGNADLISQHYGRYIVDPTTGLGSNDQPNNSRSL